MSGVVNPAFEENELNMIEAGLGRDEPRLSKEMGRPRKSAGCLAAGRHALGAFVSKRSRTFKILALLVLNLTVLTYFAFATIHWKSTFTDCELEWCNGYGMLLILLGLTYGGILYYWVIKPYFGRPIALCFRPVASIVKGIQDLKYGSVIGRAMIYLSIFTAIVVFLILDTAGSRDRLISATGVVILLSFGWLFSKHPGDINWRPVLCGLILQFTFGLLTIRWAVGRAILRCASTKVAGFLDFAKAGAEFIFSEALVKDGVFAFAVLPVIFYFSFMIQILYHLGVMQWVILKLGWALQSVMGTTLCESINSAANTFIGMSESPLLIKPYISKLTSSELHAIMCSGFATVSGTVLAAYIGFGAQPAHLLTASLMSAPAALCYSKLFYPETERSLTSFGTIKLEKSKDSGIMDAATKGALAGIPLVLGIIANIVAFVSVIAFINAILGWLGYLVGYDGLTFELILSKAFMPLSWIMGVPWEQCEDVATLIGLKTVVNEFIAYQKLGEFKDQGSIGIMIGTLSSLAPEKREQITGVIMRAFVAGSAVCFLTASIAGMLMNDEFFQTAVNGTIANSSATSFVSTDW